MLAIPEEPSDKRLWGTSPSSTRDVFYTGLIEHTPPCIEDEVAAEVECGQSCDEGYWYSESTSATTSCAASVASSEFSDDALIDIEDDDFDPLLSVTLAADFPSSSLENKLKDTCAKRSWNTEDNEGKRQRPRLSTTSESLSSNKRRRSKKSPHRQFRKAEQCLCQRLEGEMEYLSWSEMSSNEQVEAVEYITRVVSTTLGLREQLEIIRIISPDATVLPSDTEFVIDLDSFNNNKFQRIKQYVRQHLAEKSCPLCCSESRLNSCRQSSDSQHRKHSKRKSKKTLGTNHISPKSKKHKGLLGRVHKQMLKERKSGLFENEQVISINQAEEKEEELDVDILS